MEGLEIDWQISLLFFGHLISVEPGLSQFRRRMLLTDIGCLLKIIHLQILSKMDVNINMHSTTKIQFQYRGIEHHTDSVRWKLFKLLQKINHKAFMDSSGLRLISVRIIIIIILPAFVAKIQGFKF